MSISADLANINPSQLVNLTVSISATNELGAGFFLTSNAGKFSIIDSDTKLMGNGVTQNARRTGTGTATTFKVGWTAPATPGGVAREPMKDIALASNSDALRPSAS